LPNECIGTGKTLGAGSFFSGLIDVQVKVQETGINRGLRGERGFFTTKLR